jgi:hypothetical protein
MASRVLNGQARNGRGWPWPASLTRKRKGGGGVNQRQRWEAMVARVDGKKEKNREGGGVER